MSKQYLTLHALDNAHPADIFSLAVTPTQILSASGSSSLRVHSTTESDFPIQQSIDNIHPLGCHHVATSAKGTKAASVGFDGEVKIWAFQEGMWVEDVPAKQNIKTQEEGNEIWAITLSNDGRYLAGTTIDGRLKVWDLGNNGTPFLDLETKGSFGMCIALSADDTLTATGHQNGSIYVFNNAEERLRYSLTGLIGPVRAVAFSPGGKYLAAAGDSRVIFLYEVSSGEQAANLTGHAAWITSLSWNDTGEYLLSGSLDGKVKVWSIERRACVATHSESGKAMWSVKWLPKVNRGEGFATAGENRSITFYREASGS